MTITPHDHPRSAPPRRPARTNRPNRRRGWFAALVGVGLVVGLCAGAVYLLSDKITFVKRAPVPEGWERYSYPEDGFRAYLPGPPSYNSSGANGPLLSRMGISRGRLGADVPDGAERISIYTSEAGGPVRTVVLVVRYPRTVPEPVRDAIQNPSRQIGTAGLRPHSVRWLGRDGCGVVNEDMVLRMVSYDRFVTLAGIGGRFGRAPPEVEAGFFDNFDLTR